ncbi:MAG: protein kinase, partial [Gemmatimonadota bacterium]
ALADRYRIERELGQGGMATVYLAADLKHHRQVAIKILRPELAAVIGADRFLAEIRTTAALQHPHILPLFDSGEAAGQLFYVMPLIEGESLRDRLLREKQLPIGDAVRIASEVAGALDYAHRHGVIHRDIKPENILLHDGRALVADFGIALAASKAGPTRMTETGMSLGTPHYMSPEQALGEREITGRSDVYALGCVTYEMLVGEPPFTGPTAQAIIAKVMTSEPAAPSAQRKSVPPAVDEAVLTALAKLPADRFASAAEFAAALVGGAVTHGRTGPIRSLRLPARLPAFTIVAVALIALLAGGVTTAFFLRSHQSPRAASRILLQLPAAQALRATMYPGIAVPPDGSGLVYTGQGLNNRTQFLFRHWDRMQAQPLNQNGDEGYALTFSPSGDTVAYLSPPRRLNVLPLTGGLPKALSDSGLNSVTDWTGGLDWGADGQLYASGRDGLLRIDPRNGTRALVARLDSARGDLIFLWPQLLPGAKAAIVTVVRRESPSDPERASIGIADLGTGRVEVVVQGVRAIYSPTGHLIVAKPNGVLWAIPFDIRSLRTSGVAKELADTVVVRRGNAAPGVVDMAIDRAGTLVYISGGESTYEVVYVDHSGAWHPVVKDLRGPTMNGIGLSPDGRRLAVSLAGEDHNLHLWVQPVDSGPRIRLTFEGSVNMRPRWRPRTNTLSFVADRGVSGLTGLHLFERDAGGQGDIRPIAIGDSRGIGGQAWSPDGAWLVFRTDDQAAGNGDIMAIRPGIDSVPRSLVATPAEELAPAISPDGRWLAYSSNESGRREVYVRPFPNTADSRFQVSTSGGMSPLWSPDGHELYYVDAADNMTAVPLGGGTSFQTGPPRILFSTADYSISPYQAQFDLTHDGQRFVMIR